MHLVQGGTKTHLLGSRLPRQAVFFAHRRSDRDLLCSNEREEGTSKVSKNEREKGKKETEKTSPTHGDVDPVVKGLLDLLTDLVVLGECTKEGAAGVSLAVRWKKEMHQVRCPGRGRDNVPGP